MIAVNLAKRRRESRNRGITLALMIALAIGIAGFQGSGFASIKPGPTPSLVDAIAAQNSATTIDPTFGRGPGTWLATTISATELHWFGMVNCWLSKGCDTYPVAQGDAAKRRSAEEMNESVEQASAQATPWLGADGDYQTVLNADLGAVGGPSAGLMLTLAFIDAATPGDLTGGKVIAGTGTISPLAEVGPIVGVEHKVVGARQAGAEVFFVSVFNERTARLVAEAQQIELVPVRDVTEALTWLCTHGGESPVCQSPALAATGR